MLTQEELLRALMASRDALNGAINAAAQGDQFSAGAYTRNAHVILDDLLEGD